MSQHNVDGFISHLTAGEALSKNRLVRLNTSMEWVYCDAGETPGGLTVDNYASGDVATVRSITNPGTFEINLAGTATLEATLYTAADGRVSTTVTQQVIGRCNVAVASNSGNDAIPEVFVMPPRTEVKIRHVVTAGEATADTLTVNSGLGVAITWAQVQIFTSAGVQRVGSGNTVTFGSGGSAGQITVASTAMAADDVVMIHAGYNPLVV